MPKNHVVKRGECLSSIALDHGFHNWRLIYDAAQNAELRARRPNPNVLHPGDVIVIPDKTAKVRGVPTGQVHKHVITRPKWHFRLVLRDNRGVALSGIPYELAVDGGKSLEGVTGDDGLIDCPVAPGARRGELRMLGQVHPVALGALDPVTRISGVQARLANLGFDPGSIDRIYGERTARAVFGFQISQGLAPTGDADDATRKRLLKVHDDDDRCKAPEEHMALSRNEAEPVPASPGVLLGPLAEDDQREIVIVGAQQSVENDDPQDSDNASMNFYKAAQSLRPDASNRGEAVLYVQSSGYSRETRARMMASPGWCTTVIFYDSLGELASLLNAWPSHTVIRMTIIAHGYPDHIALHDDFLDASFFGPLARLFDPDGFIVSHACRTGDDKLAGRIAAAAKVPVFAWTGRTSYAHKNDDKSLTEVHPSAPPTLEMMEKHPSLAVEYIKELHSRHYHIDETPRFRRFDAAEEAPTGPAGPIGPSSPH